MVAGIGCRRGASAEEVLAAVSAARVGHGAARLDALATLEAKRDEPGIAEAAARLGLPLVIAEATEDARGLTRSAASLAATGAASVSEAAALAVAGPRARLLGPRLVLGRVTCALAEGGAS